MDFLKEILLCFTCIVSVTAYSPNIRAGYVSGISGIPSLNKTNCLNDEILQNIYLSSSPECARTCRRGQPPKTCYYKFVIEQYTANNQACSLCSPNFTNTICPNCQCVPTNGVERTVLTVNRMIPGPSIQVCQNDFIVVDVENKIDGAGLTIHWHGIFQRDFQYYDGVPFVTQCPIPYATEFRYQFPAANSGTHFWHAHTGLHKMDGITGTLVIRTPKEDEPNADLYDFDLANHVIHISDWMNEQSTERFPGRNTGAVRQLPDSLLINGRGQYRNSTTTIGSTEIITVDRKRRYRFRVINSFCTTCSGLLTIEGHDLTVIAIDGVSVQPVTVNSITSFAGERYDFVLNTDKPSGSYWIQLRGLNDCASNSIHALAILQYNGASSTPLTAQPNYNPGLNQGVTLNAVESGCNNPSSENICISELRSGRPVDAAISQPIPDYKFYLPIGLILFTLEDIFRPNTYNDFSVPVPFIPISTKVDKIIYESPPSPPLSQLKDIPRTQFCDSKHLPRNCRDNCTCTHMIRVPLNAVVEIAMVDEFGVPELHHPFHLHGYAFSVVAMGQPLGPVLSLNATNVMSVELLQELEAKNQIRKNLYLPPAKDTLAVPNNGYIIFRFHATNPVSLFAKCCLYLCYTISFALTWCSDNDASSGDQRIDLLKDLLITKSEPDKGYWLFHCHFIYHQAVGMSLIVNVGEQEHLPPVPRDFPKCGNFMPPVYGR